MTLQRFIPGEYFFKSWPSENNIEAALKREVYELRRAFERTSPILSIQKTIRMYVTRKLYHLKRAHVKILYWAFRRQLKRTVFEKFIQYHKKKRKVTTR